MFIQFVKIDFFKERNIEMFLLTDATQSQTSHDFVPITIAITNSIPSSNDPPLSHKSSPPAWIALNHRTELHTLYHHKTEEKKSYTHKSPRTRTSNVGEHIAAHLTLNS